MHVDVVGAAREFGEYGRRPVSVWRAVQRFDAGRSPAGLCELSGTFFRFVAGLRRLGVGLLRRAAGRSDDGRQLAAVLSRRLDAGVVCGVLVAVVRVASFDAVALPLVAEAVPPRLVLVDDQLLVVRRRRATSLSSELESVAGGSGVDGRVKVGLLVHGLSKQGQLSLVLAFER